MVKSSSLHSPQSSFGVPSITTTTTTTTTMNTRKNQYKGVRMRSWGSWVSEIRAPNQKTRIWLGSYSNPEAAARAYDAALLCLKGSSAALNFPGSRDRQLPPTLMSPKSIQRLAAAAAAAANSSSTTTTNNNNIQSLPSIISSPSSIEDTITTSSTTGLTEEESPIEPWAEFGEFQSPKLMDQVINHWDALDPSEAVAEEFDVYCHGDIPLWSFC